MLVGLISDTHGTLNPAVYHHFDGMDLILHAGDVGDDRILDDLEPIAPLKAVTGNVDGSPTVRRPLTQRITAGPITICMTHGHHLDPADYNGSALELFAADNPQVIVHGHSHIAKNEQFRGVAIVNPGAACKARFGTKPSIAILEVELDGRFHVRFISL
jgi:putative phosphoesterase